MRLHANTRRVLRHPGAFLIRVIKAFRANQGLLLAGAVAYYALLSLVPLLILVVIVLSHAFAPERLFGSSPHTWSSSCPGGPTSWWTSCAPSTSTATPSAASCS